MKKQVRNTLLTMLLIAVALGLFKYIQITRAPRFAPPPEVVTTAIVVTTAWRDTFDTVGSFAAVKGATLTTQESGNVVRVGFESGSKVVEGQILLELDRSVEEANLRGAEARLELARQNLSRAQMLKSQSALSAANFEDTLARAKQAEADAQSLRGIIERKTIVAPFSGRAGIRAVNVSQYVVAGTPLVPLYSVNPIHFNFTVPQQIAPALRNGAERIVITVDAFPGRSFEGTVTAVNPNINEVARSVDVQGTIANAAEELLPGMFGEVRLDIGDPREVVIVPVSAIQYAPYGNSVFVLEREVLEQSGDGSPPLPKARQQIVQLGPKRGDLVSVIEGLKAGDEIVTSGGFKLRPGDRVAIAQGVAIPASENPKVKDT